MRARHRGTFYRQRPAGGDEFGSPASNWDPTPIAADVPLNLQPVGGAVTQTPAGREARARWHGYVDPRDLPVGIRFRPDDGLVITAGRSPERFRVVDYQPRGSGWKDKLVLEETAEEIP